MLLVTAIQRISQDISLTALKTIHVAMRNADVTRQD